MSDLMSKADFARYCNVSQATVQDALRRELAQALVGKKINIEHEQAVFFKLNYSQDVALRGWAKTKQDKKFRASKEKAIKERLAEEGIDIKPPDYLLDYLDYTLDELITRHGTEAQFLDWLKATKEIEVIHEKRLKNAQIEGTLITRDLVKDHIIDPINSCHLSLMTDAAQTISTKLISMHKAGADEVELKKIVQDQLGSFITPLKKKIKRALSEN